MSGIDKELIKKYHLEEAQKRFQQICEYTFITQPMLAEDGEDDNQQQQTPDMNAQGAGQQPPQGGGNDMPQQDMGQQQPPMDNGNMPPQGGKGGMPMQGDMNGGQGQQTPMDAGSMPPPPPGDGMPEDEDNTDSMQEGDEVIDVDDLTNAQETTEVKIDGVNDKLQDLLAVTTKFIAAVDQNNKKIDDLRAEFEKRNPSEEEKINIRSQASAPYSETPKGFWDNKMKNSNYNVIYNNDVDPDKEEKEYVIKRSDINGGDDRSLSKSLDYPSKLSDFINF